MTGRERFINNALGKPADRGILWADGLWGETRERWIKEGMTDGYDFGYDFSEADPNGRPSVIYGYAPAFQIRVLEDMGEKQRIVDEYGVEKIIMKNNPGLQQFIKYPVTDKKDWESLKKRLDSDSPDRYLKGWEENINKSALKGDIPITLGGGHLCGFFSFLRETMGDDCYYKIYDDEGLVRDMLVFQAERIKKMIRNVTAAVPLDRLFIWEDMCYKNGPLISPNMFRSLLLEYYSSVIETAAASGIQIIDVDSDGNIDELLPLWLDAGVNMLHPFEVQAGMDVNIVRKKFGHNFAMHGGIDKRAIAAGKNEIDAELARIRPAYESGRYIPHADHSLPPDISFHNYLYYLDGLKKIIGIN